MYRIHIGFTCDLFLSPWIIKILYNSLVLQYKSESNNLFPIDYLTAFSLKMIIMLLIERKFQNTAALMHFIDYFEELRNLIHIKLDNIYQVLYHNENYNIPVSMSSSHDIV